MSPYVLSAAGAVVGGVAGAALSTRAKRTTGGLVGALVGLAVGSVAGTAASVLETGEVPVPAPYQSMTGLNGKPCGSAQAAAGLCAKVV